MVDIIDNNSYEYNGYIIRDDGTWSILEYRNKELYLVNSGFSTSEDAEYYIDNHISEHERRELASNEDNDLPIKTVTTRNTIRNKYKDCTGIAYVLRNGREYQCRFKKSNRIRLGGEYDDRLLVYKSANSARIGRSRSKSDYEIVEVLLDNGEVRVIG